MRKLAIISLASVVAAAVAASLIIHHQFQVKLHARDVTLRDQKQQLLALNEEHQRLSNSIATADSAPVTGDASELAKLRNEAEALKKQTSELTAQLAKGKVSPSTQPAPRPEPVTPEREEQLRQMAMGKSLEARNLGSAFFEYASDHQNQLPENLDQVASYLAKEGRSLSGSNQFIILFHGSLDQLKGIPLCSVAVVRDQETWMRSDGKMVRVYGMACGAGQQVASDDNFQSWEALHVISPTNK
jgi:hypothetical protein